MKWELDYHYTIYYYSLLQNKHDQIMEQKVRKNLMLKSGIKSLWF